MRSCRWQILEVRLRACCRLPLLSTLQTFFVSLCSHNSIPSERRVSRGNLRRLVLSSHPPSFPGACSLTAQGAPRNWGAETSSHLLTLQTGGFVLREQQAYALLKCCIILKSRPHHLPGRTSNFRLLSRCAHQSL